VIGLEVVLGVIVAAAALWLVARPLLRPGVAAARPAWEDVPDLEETRKGVALLALREIEFDRETGKLSDADYERLKAVYTAEAVTALRMEEGRAPRGAEPVEALIAARVRQLGGGAAAAAKGGSKHSCPQCGPRPEADAIFCSNCGQALPGMACRRCGTALRPDGKFCEHCGEPVAPAA
jgi:hypothetical protein